MKKLTKLLTSLALCVVTTLSFGSLYACGKKASLFATCKVHYEPLGIYYGKAEIGTAVTDGKTFAICNDTSNAVRAFQLLEANDVINKDTEGDNYPISTDGENLNTGELSSKWTNKAKTVTVTLIAENLLVPSMPDYDFVLLPCNTAYSGKITSERRAAVEDDPTQVAGKANIIAARLEDYNNNVEYQKKIDALTNAMLSKEVADYFKTKYLGAMTCDESTQIDLREMKNDTVNGNNTEITVCASSSPHAEVLNDCVKGLLEKQGYTLKVTILDWTLQNDAVAHGDYDANYFQHVPYLESYLK
ncbi:MAG TPA: hypothetical protein DEV87_00750 [Clostridiales bacterium]|nr:hypothetical protein [Clostridiales bacterium]